MKPRFIGLLFCGLLAVWLIDAPSGPPPVSGGYASQFSPLGVWTGGAFQFDTRQRYTVEMAVVSLEEGVCGAISYPELRCGGEVHCRYRENELELYERITWGRYCTPTGQITLNEGRNTGEAEWGWYGRQGLNVRAIITRLGQCDDVSNIPENLFFVRAAQAAIPLIIPCVQLVRICATNPAMCERLMAGSVAFGAALLAAQAQEAGKTNGAAPGKPTEADGYIPPKRWDGKKVKNPNGPGYGWPDRNGNVWVPTQGGAHGGPHWDVQYPGGGYDNILPGGKLRPGTGPTRKG